MERLKTREQIEKIAKELRAKNKIIVTTNGSFDILHSGHVATLEAAKDKGDILIVLINSDESIRRFKGNDRPIIPEQERAKMLAALRCVDYVVIFSEDKPLELLRSIKPHKHVKGGSVIMGRLNEEKELIKSWGGEYFHLDLKDGLSTTNIINNILEKCKNTKNS